VFTARCELDLYLIRIICLDFILSPGVQYCFLALGFLNVVRGEFTDDVSETAVGPIIIDHE
jgi:hypothetical protein